MYKIFGPGGSAVGGNTNIPEYSSDPVSPADGDVWVLRTGGSTAEISHSLAHIGLTLASSGGGGGGSGAICHSLAHIGLLMAASGGGGGGSATYQLSYKTASSGIVRVTLT